MSKANNQHLTNGRLLLILGLVMMVTVRLVRPDEALDSVAGQELIDDAIAAVDDDIITAADADQHQQDEKVLAATIYLNAIRELQAIKDKNQQLLDSPAAQPQLLLNKRQEAEPIVASRTGSVSPLYRRSALNKNFIRFGRSGYKTRQTQTSQPSTLNNREAADSSSEVEERVARESRSLSSNFIRFGRRNFFPSNKWTETISRFVRTPTGHHRVGRSDDKSSASF